MADWRFTTENRTAQVNYIQEVADDLCSQDVGPDDYDGIIERFVEDAANNYQETAELPKWWEDHDTMLLKRFMTDKILHSTEVENTSGTMINLAAGVEMMDDDLRERLHMELNPCSAQDFFAAYESAHVAKFGEEWELSKECPQY